MNMQGRRRWIELHVPFDFRQVDRGNPVSFTLGTIKRQIGS
jgi:hypothetical protein